MHKLNNVNSLASLGNSAGAPKSEPSAEPSYHLFLRQLVPSSLKAKCPVNSVSGALGGRLDRLTGDP